MLLCILIQRHGCTMSQERYLIVLQGGGGGEVGLDWIVMKGKERRSNQGEEK